MKQVQITQYPSGMITEDNFTIVELATPDLEQGEILVENYYCSSDPYQRGRMIPERYAVSSDRFGSIPQNTVVPGETVGKVIESKSDFYKIGDFILHFGGWADYSVLGNFPDDHVPNKFDPTTDKDTACQKHLVINGLVGRTAFFSLTNAMNMKPGDVVAISGATGGVGHIFIQMALKLGASKVYGITSTQEKAVEVQKLGGIPVLIPRGTKLEQIIKIVNDAIPEEIDCYHENVGNDYFTAAMRKMRRGGKMIYCGAMSVYNNTLPGPGPSLLPLIYNDIQICGCYLDNLDESVFNKFIDQYYGDLKHITTLYSGLEELPKQFVEHFTSPAHRVGKSLCKI